MNDFSTNHKYTAVRVLASALRIAGALAILIMLCLLWIGLVPLLSYMGHGMLAPRVFMLLLPTLYCLGVVFLCYGAAELLMMAVAALEHLKRIDQSMREVRDLLERQNTKNLQ